MVRHISHSTIKPCHFGLVESSHSLHIIRYQGSSWSWLYGSWIYNYLMQSVPITTKFVISNTAHGELYSIQHVIKLVRVLRQLVSCRYTGLTTNKTDHHDITDILLKLALNTTNQTKNKICLKFLEIWNKLKINCTLVTHYLSRVVVPVTLHNISVNAHFTRFFLI